MQAIQGLQRFSFYSTVKNPCVDTEQLRFLFYCIIDMRETECFF